MIVYSDERWIRKCPARYERHTAASEQRCMQRVTKCDGSQVSFYPTKQVRKLTHLLVQKNQKKNKDLTDDVLFERLRSQRVLPRSVKTETREVQEQSSISRVPGWLCLASINRVHQTAVVIILLQEQSRVFHVLSSSSVLCSATSFGRLSLNCVSVSEFIPLCNKNKKLSQPVGF